MIDKWFGFLSSLGPLSLKHPQPRFKKKQQMFDIHVVYATVYYKFRLNSTMWIFRHTTSRNHVNSV